MKKCILIDGSGLIYRGFYAIPPFLRSPDGTQTNAVYGFTNILLGLLANQKPDYMAVAFDKKGPTFRHKEFAEYKATRVKAPQELYDQIPLVKSVVASFNVPLFEVADFEADDIIATIVKKPETNVEFLIATGDFDMFQLVSPTTSILYPTKGFKGAETLRYDDVVQKYGLTPEQVVDYKGLAGDNSDNLPGVKGIGEKTAKELLKKYGTLENIYEHLSELSESQRKKLEEGRSSAQLSKKLAQLSSQAPLDFDLSQCKVRGFDVDSVKLVFEKFGFKTLSKRLDGLYGTEDVQGSLFA